MSETAGSLYASFVERLLVRTVEQDFGFDPDQYRLSVDGLVAQPRSFSLQDLKSFPQIAQVSDFHCVEGWSVQDIRWGGFRFSEIVSRVKASAQASHVIFHSLGKTGFAPKGQNHYTESLPLSELLEPGREMLLAMNMNGRPLPRDHGAPLRLVAPLKLGYKSIKFVTRIEFASEGRPGWWTLANPIYAVEAIVPENRLRRKK